MHHAATPRPPHPRPEPPASDARPQELTRWVGNLITNTGPEQQFTISLLGDRLAPTFQHRPSINIDNLGIVVERRGEFVADWLNDREQDLKTESWSALFERTTAGSDSIDNVIVTATWLDTQDGWLLIDLALTIA